MGHGIMASAYQAVKRLSGATTRPGYAVLPCSDADTGHNAI